MARAGAWVDDTALSCGGYLFSTGLLASEGPLPIVDEEQALKVPDRKPSSRSGRLRNGSMRKHPSHQSDKDGESLRYGRDTSPTPPAPLKFHALSARGSARQRSHTAGPSVSSVNTPPLSVHLHLGKNPHARRHGSRATTSEDIDLDTTLDKSPDKTPGSSAARQVPKQAATTPRGGSTGMRTAPRPRPAGFNDSFRSSVTAATTAMPERSMSATTDIIPMSARSGSAPRRRPTALQHHGMVSPPDGRHAGGNGRSGAEWASRLHGHHLERERVLEQKRAEAELAGQEQKLREQQECTFEPNLHRKRPGEHTDARSVSQRLHKQSTAAREAQLSKTADSGPGPGAYLKDYDEKGFSTLGPTTIPTAGAHSQGLNLDKADKPPFGQTAARPPAATASIPTLKEAQAPMRGDKSSRGAASVSSAGSGGSGSGGGTARSHPGVGRNDRRQTLRAPLPSSSATRGTSPKPARGASQSLAVQKSRFAMGSPAEPRRSVGSISSHVAAAAAASESHANHSRAERRDGNYSARRASSAEAPERKPISSPVGPARQMDTSLVMSRPESVKRQRARAAAAFAAAKAAVGVVVMRAAVPDAPRKPLAGRSVNFSMSPQVLHRSSHSWDSNCQSASSSLECEDSYPDHASASTPRESSFESRLNRCVDCGLLLPSEMPFCSATGKRHGPGRPQHEVLALEVRGGVIRRKASVTSEKDLTTQSYGESECATAIDRGSVAETEEISAYSMALRGAKRHGLSVKELLADGLVRYQRGGHNTSASLAGDDTEDLITDTGPGTPTLGELERSTG
eukprot:Hpha_TRINITY_DN10058_c0_g1::TRINITY_DN10058_c0_g1_i1::g.84008::m.84008